MKSNIVVGLDVSVDEAIYVFIHASTGKDDFPKMDGCMVEIYLLQMPQLYSFANYITLSNYKMVTRGYNNVCEQRVRQS